MQREGYKNSTIKSAIKTLFTVFAPSEKKRNRRNGTQTAV
jgi:hypothetical protein